MYLSGWNMYRDDGRNATLLKEKLQTLANSGSPRYIVRHNDQCPEKKAKPGYLIDRHVAEGH